VDANEGHGYVEYVTVKSNHFNSSGTALNIIFPQFRECVENFVYILYRGLCSQILKGMFNENFILRRISRES
jgi:hypothetical protein